MIIEKLDAEEETAASKLNVFLSRFCLLRTEYFIFGCFRKVAITLFDRNKPIFNLLLKDILGQKKFGLSI